MTNDYRLYLAWVIALIATAGSLYFSEVMLFRPCTLCWYQRICMYPLAIILCIATLQRDLLVGRYALPLALVGWLIALYHNLENWEFVPTLQACTIDPSSACGVPWPVWGQGWANQLNNILTIPVLSLLAFTFIIALLYRIKNYAGKSEHKIN